MNSILYYFKKVIFGFLIVVMFFGVLAQKDKLESLCALDPDHKLPVVSQALLEFTPSSHMSMCLAAWLLFILGFLLYQSSKSADPYLIAFGLIVFYIWSSLAVEAPSRILLTGLNVERSRFVAGLLWIMMPLVWIIGLSYCRYKKSKSVKAIFA